MDRRILIGIAVAVLLLVLVPGLLLRKGGSGRAVAVATQAAIASSACRRAPFPRRGGRGAQSRLPRAAEENVQQQLKQQNDQKQKFLAEMQEKLRLPPVTTKKVEVLRQHLKDGIKTDAALAASVLRGWLEEDAK